MSVKAKLSTYFHRPGMNIFIPVVNFVLTLLRRKVLTKMVKNKLNGRYELYQGGQLIHVDTVPGWLLSDDYLKSIVMKFNLRCFQLSLGDVVVDIGAGTGTEAIIFSKMIGPDGRVHAIECHPETFKSLETLIIKGGYSNIQAHQWAIGNENGTVWFQDEYAHQKNALMDQVSSQDKSISVPMRTLDQFVFENGIDRIDFLKVNIEGAELHMLEGMEQSVSIIKTAAISCHDFIEGDHGYFIMSSVRDFFEKKGFRVIHLPAEHPVVNSWLYMIKEQ